MNKIFNFSNFIVVLIIAMNLWFTDRVLSVFETVGQEPAVLIGAFFAFTTGELWLLASIKKTKVRKYKLSESDRKE